MRLSKNQILLLSLIALILAIVLKAWLVIGEIVPFNADEAVVALMARHILAGARPIFFYGQAYMGSLDAFLVAVAFGIFGQQVWVIRLVQGFLYLGVIVTTGVLGKEIFDNWRVGVIAMLMLAIPTVNITLYTTASLGGYGEALLLGNLVVICGLRIANYLKKVNGSAPLWLWIGLGYLSGLGLWAFGLTLIYSLPVVVYLSILLIKRQPRVKKVQFISIGMSVTLGGFLGSAPWWGYALQNGFTKLLIELSGGAIAGVEKLPWFLQVGQHLMSLVLLGSTVTFGLRPPWGVSWLALPLMPFVFIFWIVVIVYIGRCFQQSSPHRAAKRLLVGVALTLLVAYIFSSFGADPSGRYFLPLAVPLVLFAASLIIDLYERFGVRAYALVLLVVVFNLWGTIQCAQRLPPGISTQFYAPSQVDHRFDIALITFLEQHGENRGYSNYWVSYPIAFLSQEDLIFVPRLPYHTDLRYTDRDDRYPPYDQDVDQAERVTYITTNNPALDDKLRLGFSELGIDWKEIQIGDYLVFYALSQIVYPVEMGLGVTTP
jgi:4-amino-4-deoxy-L-arabinose transferase-like glycosyltransferase